MRPAQRDQPADDLWRMPRSRTDMLAAPNRLGHGRDRIPPLPSLRMRRWSEIAARIAATTRTSEKVAMLAEYLRSLRPGGVAAGRPLPDRPAVRRERSAFDRHRLGGDRRRCRIARRRPAGRRSVVPTTSRPTWARPSTTCSPRTATRRRRQSSRRSRRSTPRSSRSPRRAAAAAKARPLRDAAGALRSRRARVGGQDPVGRPAHRPPRGPPRGGHCGRLRPAAGRRAVGGHAHRRPRATPPSSPATTVSETPS